MCRQSMMWGFGALSFGTGILLGLCLDSGFFPVCYGLGMILFGICLLRKK